LDNNIIAAGVVPAGETAPDRLMTTGNGVWPRMNVVILDNMSFLT
jgi:phage-related protein